jgi:transposase-like protein
VSMTNSTNRVKIITSVQRRRRWTAPEKVRMVEETFEPDMTVSRVARWHGVAPNQLFTWRRGTLLNPVGHLRRASTELSIYPISPNGWLKLRATCKVLGSLAQ